MRFQGVSASMTGLCRRSKRVVAARLPGSPRPLDCQHRLAARAGRRSYVRSLLRALASSMVSMRWRIGAGGGLAVNIANSAKIPGMTPIGQHAEPFGRGMISSET